MKKILAMALVLILSLGLLAGCSSSNPTTPPAEAADASGTSDSASLGLIADGVLTVGMEAGYMPFEYVAEDGVSYIGYDVDLGQALADKMGLQVNFINTAWDGIFEGMGTNYDVVISAVTIDADRKESMDFSDPYITNYQAIVVAVDSELSFSALTDLNNCSVGMQKETASDLLLDELISTGSVTGCTPVTSEQITTSYEQLSNGEIDVVLCDSTVADSYVAKYPEKYKIAYLDEAEPEEFGVAIQKGNTALVEAINAAMKELAAEGFFEANDAKWFM